MTCDYPDLGSASDWVKFSDDLKRYPDLVKDGHQCVTQTSFHGETSNCVEKLLSRAIKLLLLSFES